MTLRTLATNETSNKKNLTGEIMILTAEAESCITKHHAKTAGNVNERRGLA